MRKLSLKSIDLQFALHKNDEAGFKQNQLSQKPQQDQAVNESQAAALAERERERSQKVDQNPSKGICQDQDQGKQHNRKGNAKKKAASSSAPNLKLADHPFKGHHIDLSL